MYASLARYCSMAERCCADVRQKLKAWDATADEEEAVLGQLQQEGFIDESRYANAFVKDKFRLNGWGRVKIRHYLYHKNIPVTLIESALQEQIDEEDYLHTLRELLKKKHKSIRAADAYTLRAKLAQFGQSRGFEVGCIMDLLDQVVKGDL